MYPEDIRALRIELDRISKVMVCKRDTLYRSREISLARTGVQLGRMWLGKMLSELTESPYPLANDLTTNKVEPEADTFTGKIESEVIEDRIMQSKIFRADLQKVLDSMADLDTLPIQGVNAYSHLEEAKMWLGQDMGLFTRKEE